MFARSGECEADGGVIDPRREVSLRQLQSFPLRDGAQGSETPRSGALARSENEVRDLTFIFIKSCGNVRSCSRRDCQKGIDEREMLFCESCERRL